MLVWIMFVLGEFLHVLAEVNRIVTAKDNPANSRLKVLRDRGTVFLVRAVVELALFGIFFEGGADAILASFKLQPPISLAELTAVMHTGAGIWFAVLLGICGDSALGYLPMLKSYVPSVDTSSTEIKQVSTDPNTGAVQTVKQTTEVSVSPAPPTPSDK